MNSLIRSSKIIYDAIINRINELGLTQEKIIKDAAELDFAIFKSQLSNYIRGTERYGLTEKQILFICSRYGLYLNINVGRPYVEGDILKFKITEYNEKECVKLTKKRFKYK